MYIYRHMLQIAKNLGKITFPLLELEGTATKVLKLGITPVLVVC